MSCKRLISRITQNKPNYNHFYHGGIDMREEQMKKYIMDALEYTDETTLEQIYWFLKMELDA